jgi:hypothetical protein
MSKATWSVHSLSCNKHSNPSVVARMESDTFPFAVWVMRERRTPVPSLNNFDGMFPNKAVCSFQIYDPIVRGFRFYEGGAVVLTLYRQSRIGVSGRPASSQAADLTGTSSRIDYRKCNILSAYSLKSLLATLCKPTTASGFREPGEREKMMKPIALEGCIGLSTGNQGTILERNGEIKLLATGYI